MRIAHCLSQLKISRVENEATTTSKTHQALQTNNTANIQVSHYYALDRHLFSFTYNHRRKKITIRRIICDNKAECAKTEQRIYFMFAYIV